MSAEDPRARARMLALISRQAPVVPNGVGGWLDRLCVAVTLDVQVAAAAVTVGPPDGDAAILAATVPTGRRFVEAGFGAGEGPTHDAWRHRRPVLVPELGGPLDGSWPGYAHIATTAGVRAVFAFPLQMGAIRLGVLTLFHDRPRRLSGAELSTCLLTAELATERLTDHSAPDDPTVEAALGLRSEVYQAQGMLAAALGVTLVDSLAIMRSHAFRTGVDLVVVATDIVHHGLRLQHDGGDNHAAEEEEDDDPKDQS